MTFLIPLLMVQAALDVVLILILGYVIFFRHRRIEHLLHSHQQNMEKLIADSDFSAQTFKRSLTEDLERIRELMVRQEQKKHELREFLQESELILQCREGERFSSSESRTADQYRLAAELAFRGLSKEEIEKQTGMSSQEIQLILDIRK